MRSYSNKLLPLKRSPLHLLGERFMAVLVVVNVVFAIFDLSYIEARDFYLWLDIHLQQAQPTAQKKYLAKVDALQQLLKQEGLDSAKVNQLLQEIRQDSVQLFLERPSFQVLNKSGTLAEIQRQFRQQVGSKDLKKALETFWSREYFSQRGWQQEIDFFNLKIRSLISMHEPVLAYDLIKGIEPHIDTELYLRKVAELRSQLTLRGLNPREVNPILAELRELSLKLVNGNYFERSQKTGTLEEIKHRIKRHMFRHNRENRGEFTPALQILDSIGILDLLAPELLWANLSSNEAFTKFWSEPNLRARGWQAELDFFDRQISFLLISNYHRHMAVNNKPVDRFWLVDLPWAILFGVELAIRIISMRRREKISLWVALGRRWFDLFLLIPLLAPLRIITALIRLDRADLVSLAQIRAYLRLGFVTSFAEEMTQAVIGKGINQLQTSVTQGGLQRAIFKQDEKRKSTYIDLNDTNEIKAIADRLVKIIACRVLPEIKPDLESWLEYQIDKAMRSASFYQKLQHWPVLKRLPKKIKDNLVAQIVTLVAETPKKSYESKQTAIPDPVSEELQKRLVERFVGKLQSELKDGNALAEIESLLGDLLEEVKVNYLNRSVDENFKKLKPASD
jgi:hypothetical protein